MSYATARAQIVTIVAGTTPVRTTKGLGAKFVHEATASKERLPSGRGFWIDADDVVVKDTLTRFSRSHYVVTMRVIVRYPVLGDSQVLDEVLVEDANAIGLRLANPTTWARTTSTIDGVDGGAGPALIPAKREAIDGGGTLLIFEFSLEYLLT